MDFYNSSISHQGRQRKDENGHRPGQSVNGEHLGPTRTATTNFAADQQEERYEGDPWEEVIGPWLENKQDTSISEVLEKCINKPQALWTQTDKIRAARCLQAQSWERYRDRQGNRLEWRYRRTK